MRPHPLFPGLPYSPTPLPLSPVSTAVGFLGIGIMGYAMVGGPRSRPTLRLLGAMPDALCRPGLGPIHVVHARTPICCGIGRPWAVSAPSSAVTMPSCHLPLPVIHAFCCLWSFALPAPILRLSVLQTRTAQASNLLKAGYEVTVWNRSPGKVEGLAAAGAKVLLPTPP